MKSAPTKTATVLGIDVGSVSLSVVQLDLDGRILNSFYGFHQGNLDKTFEKVEEQLDLKSVLFAGGVSSTVKFNPRLVEQYNTQVALMEAKRKYSTEAKSLLHIGAEKFLLIQFDDEGNYDFTKMNSSCAAGTGSFLDQQSSRLKLPGIEAFCEKALQNEGDVPDIASRCAVFAKTDLIHAQQRGFSQDAIADSLCKGLAKNIVDAVFANQAPKTPILISGGVSKNSAVIKHLEQTLQITFLQNENAHLFGALGAGLLSIKKNAGENQPVNPFNLNQILQEETIEKEYFYDPLELKLSEYPQFSSYSSAEFRPVFTAHPKHVEVDIYQNLEEYKDLSSYLGIDIGSTSTKAILLSRIRKPLVGLYTYTAGAPLDAVKAIFESIEDLQVNKKVQFNIKGVSTTGSGRSFVGKIIGADLILDEITSHARAAFELNPEADTIIEIGGQDAKFTQMDNGRVTFSQMNAVCAAGTGSFIEEQAKKLNCSLTEYASKALSARAPLASDRCTVFMERDINQLKGKGYSTNEILATVLHSVAENYLQKVAGEASIGKHVCFQGATARNKALIAAFEQRLQQPIFVSDLCHLTGALGAALLVLEEKKRTTSFRGLEIYKASIPLNTEQCDLCNNNCRISLAEISGETVAYGFLCGRDYETKKHVSANKAGFDLLKARKKILNVKTTKTTDTEISIGLPSSLHLFEEMPLWKRFFDNLSIRTISSEPFKDPLKDGKYVAGAEFCAPVTAHYGHALYLLDKADFIFMPVYLRNRNSAKNAERLYCYYTQYSASLVYAIASKNIREKHLSPFLDFSKGTLFVARDLLKCLKPVFKEKISLFKVNAALKEALSFYSGRKEELVTLFEQEFSEKEDLSVVLMGRPYVVLSKVLNKGIPEIFNKLGIKTFYQDMIPVSTEQEEEIEMMVKNVPWYFASKILETTNEVARKPNLYPVLVTAFKCSPDAFVIEYFKKLMHRHNKPYLILQIDEHDSNVGYETRIEAAIRSFRNHAFLAEKKDPFTGTILPKITRDLEGKTLLFPDWDPIVSPLLVANLKRLGIDARQLFSNEQTIRKSMAHNTGQCLPVSIVAQGVIDYMVENDLSPEKTLLWMFESKLSCNIRLYPQYIKGIFEKHGNGFEKANVYVGLLSHLEISPMACYYAYFAYMLGGLLRAVACKIRPYEVNAGETDKVLEQSVEILIKAFSGELGLEKTVEQAVGLFDGIAVIKTRKPKVAIFGDVYVCDNDVMNQDLHRAIEQAGGEVIVTTYSDYQKIIEPNRIRLLVHSGEYLKAAQLRLMISVIKMFEEKYYRYFERFLGPAPIIEPRKLEKKLEEFNINPFLSGESVDNILKVFFILENYADVKLFVQANPSFCCPSLVTEAMANEIKRITGVQVVTLTYDGTNEYKNDVILPYLQGEVCS